jgi:Zn-dependent protease with chaperone function
LITLALLVTLSDAGRAEAPASALEAAAWTLGPLVGAWAAVHFALRLARRTLDRTGSRAALARAEGLSRAFSIYLYLHAFLAFLLIGWLPAVRAAVGDLILIDEAVAAAPFLIALLAGWWSFAPIERRLIEASLVGALDRGEPVHAPPTRGQIVADRARHTLVIGAVVIAAILAWAEATIFAAGWLVGRGALPAGEPTDLIVAGSQLAIAIPVLLVAPLLIRVFWRTTPLAHGELYERIRSICDTHGVRFRDVLIWRTRGAMLNGAVVGAVGPLRYILLTDALIERLPDAQLDAVVAHEVAHVKRKHLPWLLASTAVAAVATGAAISWTLVSTQEATGVSQALHDALALGGAAAVGVFVFGFVSRRFERQADAFAAQTLTRTLESGEGADRSRILPEAAAAMSGALASVARLNHIPQTRFGFRHGSIALRIRNINALVGSDAVAAPIDRMVQRTKRATIVGALLVAAAIVAL